MKRILCLLVLLIWGHANPLVAQESAENELILIRQLRVKGWLDLARAKIDQLSKRGDPLLNAALPLESARINIAEARQKDPEQRFGLFIAARTQLQEFINKNQGKAEAALASVELARLTSYHAQAILSKAMREDDASSRHEKARPAEAKFIEAGKDLDAAVKAIEAALKVTDNADLKTRLEEEHKQARFDIAINIFDQGKTYLDKGRDDVNRARSRTIDKAREAFFALRNDESSQIGWLANAWLMKCYMELTDPSNVKKHYDIVHNRKDDKKALASVQPALRLIGYFALQDLTLPREDPESIGLNALHVNAKMTAAQRLKGVQTQAEAWLKAYSSYQKTYEGQGVLFELAYAHFAEALNEEREKKNPGPHFDKAVLYFEQLAKMDGDLAERAGQMSQVIQFRRLDTKAELTTFEQYMIKAMIDRKAVYAAAPKLEEHARKLEKANPDDKARSEELKAEKKVIDDERKKLLKDVIHSYSKALALATPKTPVQKVDDARYFLCGAYLASGDPYRAAIVAESLGRNRSTKRAPEGAATAIQTYSALQGQHPNDASIGKRLHAMAEFVLAPESQVTWKTEPVTSLAHYHLAMAANRENKAKEAIGHLEKISPDFIDYIYTQGQLVFIAEAAREKLAEDKKEQKEYLEAAKAAVKRMPKYKRDTDSPSVITMYFYAKLEMSKYMYSEAMEDLNAKEELKAVKKCNDMRGYVHSLRGEFDALPGKTISKENRDQLEFTMQIMLKYADLGIAKTKFRSDSKDRFDQVLAATKNVVDDVLAKGKGTEPIMLRDFVVTGEILGLALRANVQKGDVDKGKAILDVLQRLKGDKGQQAGNVNVVAVLLNDISGQIKRMATEKDPAFAKTKGDYTAFLDVIAKEYDKKGIDNNAAIVLANAYKSLDTPCKAAHMFSKVKAPASIDKKIEKKKVETPAETETRQALEEEAGRHWSLQVEYIRTLRACKDKDSIKDAEKAVEAFLKHPHANFKIQAMMEKNFILEETERDDKMQYRLAYGEWQKFVKLPALADRSDKGVQKIYFSAYFYMARSLYKTATLDPKVPDAARPKYITGAANLILTLEYAKTKEGWEIAGPLFKELLKEKESEQLKKEYDRLKALREKGASFGNPMRERMAANRTGICRCAFLAQLRCPRKSPLCICTVNVRIKATS